MAERQRISSGSPFEPTIGFSRAVRVGDRVVVSGTGPVVKGGRTPDTADAQARRCLEIIAAALAEAGASLDDVVRTRLYITSAADGDAVGAVHGEILGHVRPTATMVVVAALLEPSWKVEIEAEAVVSVRQRDRANQAEPALALPRMDAAPGALRALDPAERYFWLLGHRASVNALMFAELDRHLERDDIARALGALQRRHPLLRARIEVVEDELVFAETNGAVPLSILPVEAGQGFPYADVIGWTYGAAPDPMARCAYAPVEGEDRSLLVLMLDHTVLDGSTVHLLLRQLLQAIERPEAVGPASDAVPAPLHERLPPELRSPRGALDVLGAIREERKGRPESDGFPFHARQERAQRFRLDQLVLDPAGGRRLVEAARTESAGMSGQIGAAVLRACAALFPAEADRVLFLGSATDLRARVEPPLPPGEVVNAMGMLCSPYVVRTDESDTLARVISGQITREVAHGESHLFYRFMRAASYPVTAAGIESFSRAVDTAPHNVTVSNLGLLHDADMPSWVRRVSTSMGPGPNQLAFVTVVGFRGELVLNVATDVAKLDSALVEQLVDGIAARTGAHHVARSVAPDEVAV